MLVLLCDLGDCCCRVTKLEKFLEAELTADRNKIWGCADLGGKCTRLDLDCDSRHLTRASDSYLDIMFQRCRCRRKIYSSLYLPPLMQCTLAQSQEKESRRPSEVPSDPVPITGSQGDIPSFAIVLISHRPQPLVHIIARPGRKIGP